MHVCARRSEIPRSHDSGRPVCQSEACLLLSIHSSPEGKTKHGGYVATLLLYVDQLTASHLRPLRNSAQRYKRRCLAMAEGPHKDQREDFKEGTLAGASPQIFKCAAVLKRFLGRISVESPYVWLLGAALRKRSSIQEPSKGRSGNPAPQPEPQNNRNQFSMEKPPPSSCSTR